MNTTEVSEWVYKPFKYHNVSQILMAFWKMDLMIEYAFKIINSWRNFEAIVYAELILGLRPANERRDYKVTPSLIGWVQA